MGRATSAVLASLVPAKLVVEWNILAFANDASIDNESLLSSRSPGHTEWTHAAAAYAFGSSLA